jgi:poly(A) polymerase
LAEADLKGGLLRLTGSKIWPLLTRVGNFLVAQGIESYLVGGLVRDLFRERDTADIDLAVKGDALEIARQVAGLVDGKYVLLDRTNRIGRVVLVETETPQSKTQWEFDFSTIEVEIEEDLARRDFTIDAMAVDLGQLGKTPSLLKIIDPFDGWHDLQQRIIRVVAETTFESDAVRLLRAVRLAAELGFTIEGETEGLIRRHSGLIAKVAGERVREELLRIMAVPDTEEFLPYLDELGLLIAIFPELSEMKDVKQPKEHYWDVFDHSLRTVKTLDFLLQQGSWEYGDEGVLAIVPWSEKLAQHFDQEISHGSTRRSLLKLAALLHDVAKPQTKAIDAAGRMRFLGHAIEGATRTAGMLERLRFSGKEVKLVETMVRHHLRPTQMSQEGLPTRRAIYRYFRDTGEAGLDILFLSLADHLATRGPHLKLSHWQEHVRVVEFVLSQHFVEESITRPPKLIDGHDLTRIYGLSSGPKIGRILEAIREAQASGEVITREEYFCPDHLYLSRTGGLAH